MQCTKQDVEIVYEESFYISYLLVKEQVPSDSRTPTEVTPLAMARIKACCFHFSIISCTCFALAWIIGILCHHEIRAYLTNNPPKRAFNPQRVHDMLKLIF